MTEAGGHQRGDLRARAFRASEGLGHPAEPHERRSDVEAEAGEAGDRPKRSRRSRLMLLTAAFFGIALVGFAIADASLRPSHPGLDGTLFTAGFLVLLLAVGTLFLPSQGVGSASEEAAARVRLLQAEQELAHSLRVDSF